MSYLLLLGVYLFGLVVGVIATIVYWPWIDQNFLEEDDE